MSVRVRRVVTLDSSFDGADDVDELLATVAFDIESPFGRIVVATDGSDSGDRAVSFAIGIARKHGSVLEVCNAVDCAAAIDGTSLSGGIDGMALARVLEDAGEAVLREADARAFAATIRSSSSLIFGRAAEAIVEFARLRCADAIVVGTHGKRGFERFFLGSTAWDVLRASPMPTIVVPPLAESPATASGRILVALDTAARGVATLAFALRLAASERATLVLCSIAEPIPLVDQRAASRRILAYHAAIAQAHGVPYETVLADGDPAPAIVATARAHCADTIVVGTHGRRGIGRLFLGSVAAEVIRQATVPVAVIRTPRTSVAYANEDVGRL